MTKDGQFFNSLSLLYLSAQAEAQLARDILNQIVCAPTAHYNASENIIVEGS